MEENMNCIGTCKFCGQTQHLEPACDADKEMLDHIATMRCSCNEAQHYQKIYNAGQEIDATLGENFPDAADMAKKAVELVDKGLIASVSINTGDHMTVKVSANAKGEIRVVSTESFSSIIQV